MTLSTLVTEETMFVLSFKYFKHFPVLIRVCVSRINLADRVYHGSKHIILHIIKNFMISYLILILIIQQQHAFKIYKNS